MAEFSSINEVMASYPSRFYPGKAKGVDGAIQFVFTGEGGGEYHLLIRDQELDVVSGEHPKPAVTVTVRAEDWLKVNNGDVGPMALLMQGKLKVKGSLGMAAKFQMMFKPGSES